MSRNAYIAKINTVMNYINRHLNREMSLVELSEIAHYSPFHFHRIFKSVVGESPSDFIHRVRIEKAANLLLHQHRHPVTEIAMNCGFSSPSVFARAFKAHFGISATSYRRQFRNNCKLPSNPGKVPQGLTAYNEVEPASAGTPFLRVEITPLPAYRVAYHRHFVGYEKGVFNPDIYVSFRKVEQWLASKNLFSQDTVCMGITYDNPDITAQERCRYDTAFTLPVDVDHTEASEEIGIQTIDEGLYAVCRVQGEDMEEAVNKLGETVDYLYGTWLQNSIFQLADKPCLELYCHDKRLDGGHYAIDYCLPLLPN